MLNKAQEQNEGSPDLDNTINNMSCINTDTIDNDQFENLPQKEVQKNQIPRSSFLTKQQTQDQPYKAALNLSNAMAIGSASRISAYRNTNSQTRSQKDSFRDQPVSEYRNYNTSQRSKIIRSVSGTNLSDGYDENLNEQNFYKDENKDVDIGLAVKNLQESEQVVEVIDKIEENHFQAKKKVNQSDLVSLDSDVTVQTLNTCYSIVSSELVDEIINFDRENMDKKLEAALLKVRHDNSQWNKIKGEFIGLSDPVVNKDILAFRLDRVKKNLQRQEAILQKLPPIQKMLQENKTNLIQLKQSYEVFEDEVFKLKLSELDKIKTDTESLITKINSSINSLQNTIEIAQHKIQEIVPLNNDQRQKILSLQIEISNLNQRLEQSANEHRQRILAVPELKKKYEDLQEEMKQQDNKQLVDMVQKSRKIKKVVNCLKVCQELFQKLQQINNQKLNQIQFDLAKVGADSQRFQDQVSSDKNDEFQDIQKQIQKLAKKVKSDRDDQENRLDKFENQLLKTNSLNVQNEHINDADLLFLKKEVSRDRSAFASINSLVNQILEDSLKIREDQNKELSNENKLLRVSDEELQYLKANLKVLQRQDQVELPRITNNIDQLFAFSSKTLRNSLNDDNKKSQAQISKMKKNYEDLQKLIDSLNSKLQKRSKEVVALKEIFQNEDLDRELQLKTKLDDILEICAQEINSLEPIEDKKSLQQQKKDIISDINSMVTLFNENNKLIKQTNKEQNTDFEINDLVQCNKDIQKQCQELELKIVESKAFAELIDKKLEIELVENIKNIQDKFQNKNKLIDECDEQFDLLNQQIEDKQLKLQQEINKLDSLIKKLEDLSPLNQPTLKGTDNSQLLETVAKFLEEARQLRDDLEDKKEQIKDLKEVMIQAVQSLNELADRTVTFDDVLKVKNNLLSIEGQLNKLNQEINPRLDQVNKILKGVEATIDQDKSSRIQSADLSIKELEKILDQLILERQECKKKLQQLKEIIEQSKNDETLWNNPEIQDKIEQAKKELTDFQNNLNNLDQKIDEISKKTQEYKQILENAKINQNNISPQKLTVLIQQINDLKDNGKGTLQNIQQLDDQITNALQRLTDLIGQTQLMGQLLTEAHEIAEQVADDLDALEKVIESLPNQIEKMLATNYQMEKDSIDNNGDYWEERVRISGHLEALQNVKPNIDIIKKELAKRKLKFDQQQIQLKQSNEVDNQKQLIKNLKELQNLVVENVNQAVAITETAEQIKQEMGDCEIPVNSKVRKNELLKYCEKLQSILSEFQEIESSLQNSHPENETENQIHVLIKEISEKLEPIKSEEQEMKLYQKDHLEAYKESDIFSFDNVVIVKEILDFKQKIKSAFLKLKELEKIFNDLNTKMIQNDIDNASILLGKRSNKLKARLEQAFDTLKKIKKAGQDMDDNASQSEEEELIDALKNEMPEVFKNVETNFKEIEKVDISIQAVSISKDTEVMNQIKKQLSELEKKVEESEGLALKLENEIIEWNAFKKLIRRDEELQEVENICFDLRDEVVNESENMSEELEKNVNKAKSDEQVAKLTKEIVAYIQDLEQVKNKINKLSQKRDNLFLQFDNELPLTVALARDKRLQQQSTLHSPRLNSTKGISAGQRNPNAVLWDKDIYYMIFINCKYRTVIHELLKELRIINQERRELDQKYPKLKQDLNSKNKFVPYKSVKGDPIDELFAKALNSAGINLPVKRLGPGKYMFGSRQIMAKIINGKLVIRVGGGYMSADEFIEQYGKIEMAKMMKAAELNGNHESHIGQIDGPSIGIGDMKALMRQSLQNVKVYQDEHQKRESTVGKGFGEKQGEVIKNNERMSLAQLEKEYEPVKFGQTARPGKRIELTSPNRGPNGKGLVTPKAQTKR